MYIDIHCHLDLLENEGVLVDDAIERARKNRVGVIMTNGVNPESVGRAIAHTSRFKEVNMCLGIYPTDGLRLKDDEINNVIYRIQNYRNDVFGIGEVGLDFKEGTKNDFKKQKIIFEKLIKLAIKLDVPVVVHSRKAEKECIEILENVNAKKVLMHYFSGKLKLVDRIVENGWYLSIPTAVKNSEHFRKIVERVDINRMFCETDSPYSHPDKKFPNEPANVVEAYRIIAIIKGQKVSEVEKQIEDNYRRLFQNG